MRDFPFFTTEYGIAGLYLKEVPYRQEALIRILDVQEEYVNEHLAECISFCRMCGAERILATGHPGLEVYPLYTCILEMRGTACSDERKRKCLFPVTEETVGKWRQIHNERLRNVDCAATLEGRDENQILASGSAYFVHDCGELLGIGWVQDCQLKTVAALKAGAGDALMNTLMSLMEGETMTLEVASTNERAIRLYEKLGFVKSAEKTRWYRVL